MGGSSANGPPGDVRVAKASQRKKMAPTPLAIEQGKRLRKLRERMGISKPALAAALGFDTTQAYELYERGATVLRLDRIDTWAAAFGISEQEFLNAVVRGNVAGSGDFQTELLALVPDAPRWVEDMAREHADDGADGQAVLLDFIRRLIAEDSLSIPERFRDSRPQSADRAEPPVRRAAS